jgi:hypothetical protein
VVYAKAPFGGPLNSTPNPSASPIYTELRLSSLSEVGTNRRGHSCQLFFECVGTGQNDELGTCGALQKGSFVQHALTAQNWDGPALAGAEKV